MRSAPNTPAFGHGEATEVIAWVRATNEFVNVVVAHQEHRLVFPLGSVAPGEGAEAAIRRLPDHVLLPSDERNALPSGLTPIPTPDYLRRFTDTPPYAYPLASSDPGRELFSIASAPLKIRIESSDPGQAQGGPTWTDVAVGQARLILPPGVNAELTIAETLMNALAAPSTQGAADVLEEALAKLLVTVVAHLTGWGAIAPLISGVAGMLTAPDPLPTPQTPKDPPNDTTRPTATVGPKVDEQVGRPTARPMMDESTARLVARLAARPPGMPTLEELMMGPTLAELAAWGTVDEPEACSPPASPPASLF